MPLTAERGFLPDLAALQVPPSTSLLWLGYPSNPTGAVADLAFFEEAVAAARRHDLLLCHDAAELVHIYIDLMNAGAPHRVIRDAVFIHPTLAEAVQSAISALG